MCTIVHPELHPRAILLKGCADWCFALPGRWWARAEFAALWAVEACSATYRHRLLGQRVAKWDPLDEAQRLNGPKELYGKTMKNQGSGPTGGSWQSMSPSTMTLSPGSWMDLPGPRHVLSFWGNRIRMSLIKDRWATDISLCHTYCCSDSNLLLHQCCPDKLRQKPVISRFESKPDVLIAVSPVEWEGESAHDFCLGTVWHGLECTG